MTKTNKKKPSDKQSKKKNTAVPVQVKPEYTMLYISSDQLKVARDRYQKPLNDRRVSQIVADFDEHIANEPKVSLRNGEYYVFDGQHSVDSRVRRNGGKPLPILCKVYQGLSEEQEAMLFSIQTGHASKPTPAQRLRARLCAGDKESIAFKTATESAGFFLDMDGSRSVNHIHCINTALALYRKLGDDLYKEALAVLRGAWGGSPDSLRNDMLIAVCRFIHLYQNEYNRSLLIDALKNDDPLILCREIQCDFVHPGFKRHIDRIYRLYTDTGALLAKKH